MTRYTGELDSWDNRHTFGDDMIARVTDTGVKKIVVMVVYDGVMESIASEDPIVYAGEILHKWENSEAGKWVMEHSVEKPIWDKSFDTKLYTYRIRIAAKFYEEDAVYFTLKFKS